MKKNTPPGRYLFIDLYRSVVILLMLEGHVLRAFLLLSAQKTDLFQFHEFFHGLSAPAFLFGAGLTFVISTKRRWEEYHHWDPPLARRLKRLMLVILLGYFLHLPYLSFRKIMIDGTAADYVQLFQCDVLHCIGIGLLSLHALIFFFKKESKFYALVMTTVGGVCFLTPFIWDIDFTRFLPVAVAQMLSGNLGSPFPLFPYVGFLYAGVIISWEFLVAVDRGTETRFVRRLALAGILFVITGVIFDNIPVSVYPTYNYWFTSPNYFLVRTGSLMIIISGIWYIAPRITKYRRILTILGIESLFVYIMHLLIIYGSVINPESNLLFIFGTGLPLVSSIGIFTGLLAVMLVAALFWNHIKREQYNLYRIIQLAAAGILLTLFFTIDH